MQKQGRTGSVTDGGLPPPSEAGPSSASSGSAAGADAVPRSSQSSPIPSYRLVTLSRSAFEAARARPGTGSMDEVSLRSTSVYLRKQLDVDALVSLAVELQTNGFEAAANAFPHLERPEGLFVHFCVQSKIFGINLATLEKNLLPGIRLGNPKVPDSFPKDAEHFPPFTALANIFTFYLLRPDNGPQILEFFRSITSGKR